MTGVSEMSPYCVVTVFGAFVSFTVHFVSFPTISASSVRATICSSPMFVKGADGGGYLRAWNSSFYDIAALSPEDIYSILQLCGKSLWCLQFLFVRLC